MPDWLIGLFAFALGASFGSFANVCIYRLPRRLSLIVPRSHCPVCGETLGLVDLVPLLSYLWLGARCRFCKWVISPRYFLVEAACGTLFFLSYKSHGFTTTSAITALSCLSLLILGVVDGQFHLVPTEPVWALFGIGLLRRLLEANPAWGLVDGLLGTLIAGSVIYLVGVIGTKIFKKEAMGWGDVEISAAVAIQFGASKMLLAYFILSVFLGALVALPIIIRLRSVRGTMPLGVALAGASILLLLYPEPVSQAVLRIYHLD
ncbi:MAG: prepilin peptidase [Armatimonadetes bacterium]|nr:prepilin peptidase [Armatimonadota bacterium]MDW8122946.1 prepilin peptidase [Armatimonadota bacterium]